MKWVILSILALLPLGAFLVTYRWGGRRHLLSVAVAGAVGAAIGAFIGSATSAMATAVDPTTAALRAGAIGAIAGVAIGGTGAVVLSARTVYRVLTRRSSAGGHRSGNGGPS